jgi:hypothetical protein
MSFYENNRRISVEYHLGDGFSQKALLIPFSISKCISIENNFAQNNVLFNT